MVCEPLIWVCEILFAFNKNFLAKKHDTIDDKGTNNAKVDVTDKKDAVKLDYHDSLLYICNNILAKPLNDAQTGEFSFFSSYPMSKIYNKTPFTTAQIIAKLKKRGLIFSNQTEAEHFLKHTSHYRLKAYMIPFQNAQKMFIPNTDFKNVIELYEFDNELRTLLGSIIEKIEISIRTSLVDDYSLSKGSNWYEDVSLFKDAVNHVGFLQGIDESINTSKESFIKHYKQNYNASKRPPAWMIFEILTFGTLSFVFKQLAVNNDKKKVALKYRLTKLEVFESWLHTFSYIRNASAHHARLWNKALHIKPIVLKKANGNWINTNGVRQDRLYLTISCMKYLLDIIVVNNTLRTDLKKLFTKYPSVNIWHMGFPKDWEKQPLWK